MFAIVCLEVHPGDIGFHFVRRPRTYTILYNRRTVVEARCIKATYQAVVSLFQKRLPTRFAVSCCFVASGEELRNEELSCRKMRKLIGDINAGDLDWHYLLTPCQRRRLQAYWELWVTKYGQEPESDRSAVFDLSQNPGRGGRGGARMTSNNKLPTLLTTSYRFWAPCLRRWLLPRELAMCMGWPVTPGLSAAAGVPHQERRYTTKGIGTFTCQ